MLPKIYRVKGSITSTNLSSLKVREGFLVSHGFRLGSRLIRDLIEVGYILGIADVGHIGRVNCLIEEGDPLHILEPLVLLYVPIAVDQVAKTGQEARHVKLKDS